MVKAKTSEGLIAKLLTEGIMRIAVVLISKSSGAFFAKRPTRGRCARPWAVLGRHSARAAAPRWAVGLEGSLSALSFF